MLSLKYRVAEQANLNMANWSWKQIKKKSSKLLMVTFVYHSIHVFNALMPRISAPYFSSFDRQSANIGHMNKAHCQKKKIKILIFC
jgi:hypothetical protein